MKVWNGYGSEHSMNLVMVGQFKTIEDAEKTKELIESLPRLRPPVTAPVAPPLKQALEFSFS